MVLGRRERHRPGFRSRPPCWPGGHCHKRACLPIYAMPAPSRGCEGGRGPSSQEVLANPTAAALECACCHLGALLGHVAFGGRLLSPSESQGNKARQRDQKQETRNRELVISPVPRGLLGERRGTCGMCQKGQEEQVPGQARGLPCGYRCINSSWVPGGQCPRAFGAHVVRRKAAPHRRGEQASEFLLNHSTA